MTIDTTRRGFLELASASAVAQIGAPLDSTEDDLQEFDGYGLLLGPESALPQPGGAYLEQYDTYRFVYFATDSGRKSWINHTRDNWHSLSMDIPQTQVDEVRTENFKSFFNHTFARPEAPDDKNWEYTAADVTKFDSEIELASTTSMQTTQRGNYPPGSEAIPGVALRITSAPSAGEGRAGYFTDNNGLLVGEDTTDSFAELRKGGSTHRVYRTDWNGFTPQERLWVSNRPVVTRFPHLFYGGGDIHIRAIIHGDEGSELKTLHTFTPDNVTFDGDGPPFDQPNLPVRFESASLSGGALRANAAHYEFGEVETENRVNGEHFDSVSVGTSDWTPLLIWQKRDGWEMVNVKPLRLSVAATSSDAKLAIQLNPTLSSTTTTLPTNTSSRETAVEIVDASFDEPGERRWVGYATAGQGNSAGSVGGGNLNFNLPATQPVALVAQGVGGTAELSGFASWEEYF